MSTHVTFLLSRFQQYCQSGRSRLFMYPLAWHWWVAPLVPHTQICHVSGMTLVTSIHRRLRGHAEMEIRVGTFPSVMFTYFYEIMKISTICIRNSSWMVIGSYAGVVFLPFIPVCVLGLVYLLLRRADLSLLDLTRSSVCVRVLISVVTGWLVGTARFLCCDGPLLCAGDRCGNSCARASDAVIPIV